MAFTVQKKTFPNGDHYLELSVGDTRLGMVTEVEGGYLASGRKKPVATLDQAAKQCIQRKINAAKRELAFWEDALACLK